MNTREEFEKWFDTQGLQGSVDAISGIKADQLVAYQAATSSTAAKYEARIKELEEALQPFAENIPEDYKAPCHSGITTARKCGRCSRAYKAYLALSTTSPDKELKRALLEARIDEQSNHSKVKGAWNPTPETSLRVNELRAELETLNLEGE